MTKRKVDGDPSDAGSSKKHKLDQEVPNFNPHLNEQPSDQKQASPENSSSSDLERRVSLLRKRLKKESITTDDDLSRIVHDIVNPAPPTTSPSQPSTFFDPRPFTSLYPSSTPTWSTKFPPPTLPPINDPALLSRVFTHRGTIHGSVLDVTYKSYERLEFLGDVYIELAASRCLYHGYESMPPQALSKAREALVCNDTLASIALRHSFDDKTHVPVSHTAHGQDRTSIWKKMLGDVLEAYVAALVLDDPEHGYCRVEKWLYEEWRFAGKLPETSSAKPFDPVAKQALAKKVGGKVIKIEYEECRERVEYRGGATYTVGVYVTGWGFEKQVLGIGKGKSVKEAGHMAASEALGNPLTAQMNAIKREFDAKVAEEREKMKAEGVEEGKGEKTAEA